MVALLYHLALCFSTLTFPVYCTATVGREYKRRAKQIDELLEKYARIREEEEPCDVFISVKQGDEDGRPTKDSQAAQDLYYKLVSLKRKDGKPLNVFNSRITLSDKCVGAEYEPYIIHALTTAKVLIVLCTKKEYITAPWVQNEWRRYLYLMRQDPSRKLILLNGLEQLDIPQELRRVQYIDLNSIDSFGQLKKALKMVVKDDQESAVCPRIHPQKSYESTLPATLEHPKTLQPENNRGEEMGNSNELFSAEGIVFAPGMWYDRRENNSHEGTDSAMAGNRAHAMKTRKKKEPFTFSKLSPKQKKIWKWGAIIAACLIVVIVVLAQCDLLPHFKGNLHLVGGKLLGVDANDVVINLSDDNEAEYYKIGRFDVPEGFELLDKDTFNVRSDELETEWAIKPAEGYQGVEYIAVCGTSESAEARREAVRSLGAVIDEETSETIYPELTEGVSPVKNIAFGGYIYGDDERDTYSGKYHRYYSTFIPGTEEDSSIMVMITCKAKNRANLPDAETLVELMGKVVDGITTK